MPYTQKNLHNKILGGQGEEAVVKYIKKHHGKILERNYMTPFGEADIIAKFGDEIAFVEVKTRLNDHYGSPAEAVDETKKARYRTIAKCYWAQHRKEPNARFDVAEVYGDGSIAYYDHAFY